MLGGIHRFDEEAQPGQVVDSLNAVEWDGAVRRRPGFRSFAHGPMLHLPEGNTTVIAEDALAGQTVYRDRTGALGAPATGQPVARLIVLATEAFDGLDFRIIRPDGPDYYSVNSRLVVEYWDGFDWALAPWFLDQTRGQTSNDSINPLARDGTIVWHRSQFTGWTARTLGGLTGYAVSLRKVTTAGAAMDLEDIISVEAPGIRAFLLEPVNGLIPSIVGNGRRSIVVCGDRRAPRGLELGAQAGVIHPNTMTETIHLVADEGGAVIDVLTWPRWRSKLAADAVYTASAATASPTTGTAGAMTKGDSSYDWNPRQFAQSRIRIGITPVGVPTVTYFDASIGESADGDFEHCWLLCTTLGGVALGEYVQVRTSTYDSGTERTRFYVYPDFSAAPTGFARFSLLSPPVMLRADQYWPREWPVRSNTAQTLVLETEAQRPYGTYFGDVLGNIASRPSAACEFTFQVGSELRWQLRAGRRWSFTMDPITRTAILTNGEGPLFQWNGERLRKLTADNSSINALTLAGLIHDEDVQRGTPGIISPAVKLRATPPRGPYVHLFQGRIFVGPVQGEDRDRDFMYSEAGGYNDVWLVANRGKVSDRHNLPLRGFFTLNGRLHPFTAASIHEAQIVPVTDREAILVRPRVEGVGFLSHHAVGIIPMGGAEMAIAPTADGLGAFNGSSVELLVPDWAAIAEGGVNVTALQDSVATVLRSRDAYVLAFAPRGTQQRTRLLWLNTKTGAKWLWTSPFGVSSLATMTTETGEERLLIGTDDGLVSTLCEQELDDGEVVTGFVKTAPLRPYVDHEALYSALVVTGTEGGAAQALEVTPYMNRSGQAETTAISHVVTPRVYNAGDPQPTWGATPAPEFGSTNLSQNRIVTSRMEFPNALRGHTLQLRISGTWLWRLHSLELLTSRLGIQGRR